MKKRQEKDAEEATVLFKGRSCQEDRPEFFLIWRMQLLFGDFKPVDVDLLCGKENFYFVLSLFQGG